MMLELLVEQLGGRCRIEGAGPRIRGVELDSRRVSEGDLFVALPGEVADGARFIPQAIRNGACAVLAPEGVEPALLDDPASEGHPVPLWVHDRARSVAGEAAALVFGAPARGMKVIAITGTNGKTTTAHIAGHLLEACGLRPAVLGTAGNRLADGVLLPATHTTPDAPALQRLMRRHQELGGDSLVLEVSSHALCQERIAGLDVGCAVFTNLSRDHLDYHEDLEQYAAAKALLFSSLGPDAVAVLNADDPRHTIMMDAARSRGARVYTYGTRHSADLCALEARSDLDSTYLTLSGMGISPPLLVFHHHW